MTVFFPIKELQQFLSMLKLQADTKKLEVFMQAKAKSPQTKLSLAHWREGDNKDINTSMLVHYKLPH